MISLNQLTVSFGGFDLFKQISFLVSSKERVGLVGKNGAGKTTLLRLIVGQMAPTSGSINIPKEVSIGYLPQQMDVANSRTVINETMLAFEEAIALHNEIDHITKEIENRTDYQSDSYAQLINDLTEKSERYGILGGDTLEAKTEVTLLGLGFRRSDFSRPTLEFSGGWRMRI
ncbi:MAG TPA: glycosyl transferase family 2, partial [Bacteroidales bacterium]|nr:glycosyl transferase family 2 [Bacteroidales bacterium]